MWYVKWLKKKSILQISVRSIFHRFSYFCCWCRSRPTWNLCEVSVPPTVQQVLRTVALNPTIIRLLEFHSELSFFGERILNLAIVCLIETSNGSCVESQFFGESRGVKNPFNWPILQGNFLAHPSTQSTFLLNLGGYCATQLLRCR